MRCLVESNTEIVRFDIPMDKVSVVDVLNSSNHLVDEHEDRFQGEFSQGLVEKGLK